MLGLVDKYERPMTPDFTSQSLIYKPGTGFEICSWKLYEQLHLEQMMKERAFNTASSPEL
jgi:hypothetical protein